VPIASLFAAACVGRPPDRLDAAVGMSLRQGDPATPALCPSPCALRREAEAVWADHGDERAGFGAERAGSSIAPLPFDWRVRLDPRPCNRLPSELPPTITTIPAKTGPWPQELPWGGAGAAPPFCIPYGALVSAAVDNLLPADKCFSSSHMGQRAPGAAADPQRSPGSRSGGRPCMRRVPPVRSAARPTAQA